MRSIIVVGGDGTARTILQARGFSATWRPDPASLVEQRLEPQPAALLIVCVRDMGDGDAALGAIRSLRQSGIRKPILLLAEESSEDLAIRALRSGVTDYLRQPCTPETLIAAVDALVPALGNLNGSHRGSATSADPLERMVGRSRFMQELREYLPKVAASSCNVLVTGETGTGKELIAEMIHQQSPRNRRPFVCINCAAVPDSLLESELFGYERGAFTGANTTRDGKLREADNGTIFFDEVGDMSPLGQAKVLRAIESGQVQRLGGKGSIPVNLRIVTATNQDLERQVAESRFRKDLFFRINVARIHLPPLRERREDVAVLLWHYLNFFNRKYDQDVRGFTDEALDILLRYDWPGNVRELKNAVEAMFVRQPDPRIEVKDLPPHVALSTQDAPPSDCDRDRVISALMATRWNKSKAAQSLRWSRMTLYRKMARYGIASS